LSKFHYCLFEGGHFFWQKKSYNAVITTINNIISKEVETPAKDGLNPVEGLKNTLLWVKS